MYRIRNTATSIKRVTVHLRIYHTVLRSRTTCTIRRRTECLQEHGTPYSSIINRSIPVLQDDTVEENYLPKYQYKYPLPYLILYYESIRISCIKAYHRVRRPTWRLTYVKTILRDNVQLSHLYSKLPWHVAERGKRSSPNKPFRSYQLKHCRQFNLKS